MTACYGARRPTVAYCLNVGCLHLSARTHDTGQGPQTQAYCKLSGRPPAKMMLCPGWEWTQKKKEELLKHNPYSCKDRAKNRAAEIEEEPEFRPWEKPIPESQARITSWGDGQ